MDHAAHEAPDPGPLLPRDQLCFTLHAASRSVMVRYRPLLDVLELTFPQYVVMLAAGHPRDRDRRPLPRRIQ